MRLLDGALFGLGLGAGLVAGLWLVLYLAIGSLRRRLSRQLRKIFAGGRRC